MSESKWVKKRKTLYPDVFLLQLKKQYFYIFLNLVKKLQNNNSDENLA